ncbi:MAG: PTS sugar transporter subunit IIA [Candidatus Hydrogenedentota bacterium]
MFFRGGFFMKITEIMSEDLIEPSLKATTKDEVIEELVDLALKKQKNIDKSAIIAAVKQREELMSTGIGNDIGLPHAKTNAVPDLIIAFGRSLKGIDFGALDGRPVKIFYLLLAPEDQSGPHVKALAHISRLLKHAYFRDALLSAKNAKEIYEIIKEEEKQK